MREMEMTKRHSSARTVVLFACISVLIIGLFACDDRKDGSSAHSGKLRLSLAADTTSLKKGVNSNLTKAVSDEFEKFLTVEDYQIRIVTDKDTVKSYDRFDKMPSEIELPEGAYTIVASKGNDLPAAFENPYFEGSTAFTIKEGMSTPLDMTCTLGNARITAEYTDDFKEAYSDYTALLSSTFATTEFEIAKGETRPAYMQVAKEGTDVAIGIRLKKINTEEEKTYYVPTALKLERRQNVRLVFKTDGEALEGIGLTIMLDDSLTKVDLVTEIPDFMWKPFDKPTLSPDGFSDNEEMHIKTSEFDKDLRIGFAMPAGIGSLIIKQWIDDNEDDAESIDLVTNPELAIEKNFSWMIADDENPALKDVRKPGYLIMKNAIKSLKAPEEGSTVYHYKFYGTDAAGKHYATNELNLTVEVQAAAEPYIADYTLPAEIVEGDVLDATVSTKLIAEGGIHTENTVLTIQSNGTLLFSCPLMDESARLSLAQNYDIIVESENSTEINVTFGLNFTTLLSVSQEANNESYEIKLHLEDNNGKKQEKSKELLVKVPVFELLTTEGDAFAKRIVLRSNLIEGNKNNLSFQYRQGHDSWCDISSQTLKTEDNLLWVDTLKNLMPETEYAIRAVYNKGRAYKRYSEEKVLTTEMLKELPNSSFEYWNIQPDGKVGDNSSISGVTGGKLKDPYRCWEIWEPWTSSENSGWNTRNRETTQDGDTKESRILPLGLDGFSGTYSWTRYTANSGTLRVEGNGNGNAALIRTVGWGNGCTAADNASVIKRLTPGELYLGTCNDKTPNYGIAFTSRPQGFIFDYKYLTSDGSDKFVAQIVLKASDGTIIAEAQLSEKESVTQNTWKRTAVYLKYVNDEGRLKAAQMYILFKSSNTDDYDTLRNRIMVWPANMNVSNEESVGSQLYIDNVELIYE